MYIILYNIFTVVKNQILIDQRVFFQTNNRSPKSIENYGIDLGSITSRNSVGPTSVFLLNEHISLHKSSKGSIINHSITVQSKFEQYNRKPNGNAIASSTVACGVIELCDINCQKSLSLAGAEIENLLKDV